MGKDSIDCESALLWASMPHYKRKQDRAINIIRGILAPDTKHTPMVAFSCGKDSSVLAHMVLRIDPYIPLRFLSSGETRLVHNVDDIIAWFQGQGAIVEELLVDRVFSEEWKDATWTEQRKAGKGDIWSLNERYDLVFMGLRKEESRAREITLNKCKTDGLPPYCYQYAESNKRMSGMVRCCPLAEWTVRDIAAYIAKNNMPVLSWYQDMGIDERTTARLTGDAVRQNVLTWVKARNPSAFNQLAERFPEFRMYV